MSNTLKFTQLGLGYYPQMNRLLVLCHLGISQLEAVTRFWGGLHSVTLHLSTYSADGNQEVPSRANASIRLLRVGRCLSFQHHLLSLHHFPSWNSLLFPPIHFEIYVLLSPGDFLVYPLFFLLSPLESVFLPTPLLLDLTMYVCLLEVTPSTWLCHWGLRLSVNVFWAEEQGPPECLRS